MWGQPPSAVRRAKPGSVAPPNWFLSKNRVPGNGTRFFSFVVSALAEVALLLRAHRAKAFPV